METSSIIAWHGHELLPFYGSGGGLLSKKVEHKRPRPRRYFRQHAKSLHRYLDSLFFNLLGSVDLSCAPSAMSRHNPIFPTDDLVLQTDAALPSSVSSTSQIATGHSYIDGLSRAHAKLAAVPQELCDSPCPASESHVDLIRDKTRSALKYANHDPSDAKWSHVARILRMASTSRKYRGIAEGVRAGEVKNVEVGDYKWVLPATEAEWADCEKRWKQRSLTAVGPTRASRYWADSGNKVAEQDAQAGTPSKAALVRHKVKQWQATVLPATQGSLLPPSGDQLLAKKAESGKEKEGEPKRQSPLTFPVTKRSAVAGSKINVVGEPLAQYPHDPPAALQITDLSEMVSSRRIFHSSWLILL